MSEKMPVTDLLTESFSFGFNRFGTVLRCLLIPYIILVVGMIAVAIGLLDFEGIAAIETNDPDSMAEILVLLGEIFRVSLPLTIVIFLAASAVLSIPYMGGVASIFRLVGLGEEPGGWFSFRLDGPMWRTFFAYLIWGIIQYSIYGIAAWLAWQMSPGAFDIFRDIDQIDTDPGMILPFVSFFVWTFIFSIIPMIIIFTRIAPFPAASACENRLMLVNSWNKTAGHFWTILGAYILLILAMGIAQIAFQLISSVFQGLIEFGAAMGGGGIIVLLSTLVLIVVSVLFTVFVAGVQMAFPAAIYRRLWQE